MLYNFSLDNRRANNSHLVQFESGLKDEEIQRIIDYGDSLATTNVKLYGKFDETSVNATGSHFSFCADTAWLYDKMAAATKEINEQNFQYDLIGFAENFYYLRYEEGNHFNWHLDIGAETPTPRKLSLVLQLSDPIDYDGGEFDVLIARHHVTAERRKGLINAFPSFKIHRVRPVTRGIRRTLTMFASGPNFR